MKNKEYISYRAIAHFKKWTNKGFSAFNSLGKIIKIAVLSYVYFSGICTVKAETKTIVNVDSSIIEKEVVIEEILINAKIPDVGFSEFSSVVTSLSIRDIILSPVQNIQSLLEYNANIDIRQRGKFGTQADINLRGGHFDQTLILLNGININDPQTGHHNLNLPIDIASVEYIEILKGSGARIFGPNAFSGVINFVTGISDRKTLKGRFTTGQYGFLNYSLSSSFFSGPLKNHLQVSHIGSDGYIKNTDFDRNNIFYHGQLPLGKSSIDVQLSYLQNGFGANSFYTPVYPNQYEKLKTAFGSIGFKRGKKIQIQSSVYFRRNQDRFELFRDNKQAPDWYHHHNHHLTNVLGAKVNVSVDWLKGKSLIGINIRKEKIKSNVLGIDMPKPQKVPGQNAYFTKKDDRTDKNLFLNHSMKLGFFFMSAGILADWNTILNNELTVYPGMDVSFDIDNSWSWFASVNKSLRFPTFTDLYYKGPTNIGNPNLRPEKTINIESGLKWKRKAIGAYVAFYKRFGKDMIDWVRKNEKEKWLSMNLTDIDFSGMETFITIYPQYLFSSNFPMEKIVISYSFNKLNKNADEYLSFYVLDNLKHKLDVDVHIPVIEELKMSLHLTWQDRNGTFTYYDKTSLRYNSEQSYTPFWLLDMKLYKEMKNYTLFIEASNLLDQSYFDIGNVEQPGRWIRGGISFQFDL